MGKDANLNDFYKRRKIRQGSQAACTAYLAYPAYLAYIAYPAYLAYLAYLSYLAYHQKSSPGTSSSLVPGLLLLFKRRRLPTLPHCIAVPSAQAGLTSLFGMGRGGTPPQ